MCIKCEERPVYVKKSSLCKRCAEIVRRKDKQTYNTYQRTYNFKKLYGITVEEYDAQLELQGGVCAICKREQKNRLLAVDHDHKTGKVRGLLCTNCNQGLGKLQDSPELLTKAAEYVKHGGVWNDIDS